MHFFETLIALLAAAAVLSVLAARIRAPYPALLALGGAVAALIPGVPQVRIEPELALALFIAPVLVDAAYDFPLRDLRDNWVPITFLTLAAVGLTTIGVAWTAKSLAPDLPWAAAVALGAIVAPPDAAAASAVLKFVRPPYRVLSVLQGESLFNDASSLLIYRIAVGAIGTGALAMSDILPPLLLATVGSVALGWVLALAVSRLTRSIEEPPPAIVLQFCGAFGVWILAEILQLSAIITVVVFAMVIARSAYRRIGAVVRGPSYTVWETAVFALNALAFLLVGLQVGPILEDLSAAERTDYAGVAFAVLVAVIVIRIGWVMSYGAAVRLKNRLFGVDLPDRLSPPTLKSGIVVSWAGMRGTVSLAAAYALPETFPGRDLLLVCTFAVVLGTLVLQGFTLGPLIRWLGLKDDGVLNADIRLARVEGLSAALAAIEGDASPEAEAHKRELRTKLDTARNATEGDGRADTASHALRRKAIAAERVRLDQLRHEGAIGDEAYHQLEEELDRMELSLTPVVR